MLLSRHNHHPHASSSNGFDVQTAQLSGEGWGCRAVLITGPETHQRHPAQTLWVLSKLPAKGGSAPDLHLVSLYGNRKQLLAGECKTQVKGDGGLGERNHS